ncbi:MAG: DUF6049 family protein, partial [Nocardioidaceae bacterium]|nr:DUF6049 family protein [Nocardioidaceae bacterium]
LLGDVFSGGKALAGEALTSASNAARGDTATLSRLTGTRAWVESQLAKITVDAPAGVSLSGSSGGFTVSVRNGLDQPVTVHLVASTDDGARIEVANPIRLGARSRSSVPVSAEVSSSGVHNLNLQVADPQGRPIGGSDTVPLRSGQSSVVIWAIIGVGAGILFLAIGIRLIRRFRRFRRFRQTRDPAAAGTVEAAEAAEAAESAADETP